MAVSESTDAAEEIELHFRFQVRVKQATLKRFVHPVKPCVKIFEPSLFRSIHRNSVADCRIKALLLLDLNLIRY